MSLNLAKLISHNNNLPYNIRGATDTDTNSTLCPSRIKLNNHSM